MYQNVAINSQNEGLMLTEQSRLVLIFGNLLDKIEESIHIDQLFDIKRFALTDN